MIPLVPILIRAGLWIGGSTLAALGVGKLTKLSEEAYFNNGKCTKCGGHFKYISGTRLRGKPGYRCDRCDNCVWIAFGTDKGYIYTPSRDAIDK